MIKCVCYVQKQPGKCCDCCCGQFERAIAEKMGLDGSFAFHMETAIERVMEGFKRPPHKDLQHGSLIFGHQDGPLNLVFEEDTPNNP